jgi:putative DNA primase/helicase
MDRLTRVLDALGASKSGPETWIGKCPCHGHEHTPLTIRRNHSGGLRLRCRRGCPESKVISKAKISREDLLSPSLVIDAGSGLLLRYASAVEPEPVQWLWPNYLPLGAVTLLGSNPNQGKSTLSTAIAAAVTAGKAWPDGAALDCPVGDVVLLSAEDVDSQTIVPRAIAAGANPKRIKILKGAMEEAESGDLERQFFQFDRHLERLSALLEDNPAVRLVVVDPFEAFLGGVNPISNPDVRRILTPLAALAEDCQVAILVIQHLNKRSDVGTLHRMAGSVGIAGAARVVLALAQDKNDSELRYLFQIKNNLGPGAPPLAFRIQPAEVQGVQVGRVAWMDGPVEVDLEDLITPGPGSSHVSRPSAVDVAAEFLEAALAGGPRFFEEIKKEAEAKSIAEKTLRRAFRFLGGISKKETGVRHPRNLWRLPPRKE